METIDLSVPASWSELTQPQLRSIFILMVRYSGNPDAWLRIAAAFVPRYNGIRIVSPYGRNWLIRVDGREFVMDSQEFTRVCGTLGWLKDIPAEPVRLDLIDGAEAMPPDPTYDLTLEQWLACENYYQGYQYTQDAELLRQMAAILYRKENISLTPAEEISIFYWWSSVKLMVSCMFPHFFRPAPVNSSETPDADTVRRSVDAQIRALTKGDISKEDLILSMPSVRTLTELDALAREYEELNRKYPGSQCSMHNA